MHNIFIFILVIFIFLYIFNKKTQINIKENKIQNKVKVSIKDKNYKEREYKDYKEYKEEIKVPSKKPEDLVYMDIGFNGKFIGRVTIKLFSNIVPKTCKNFRTLCENANYKDSPFHRIISDFMIQGGDFTNGDGTGGKSIYGNTFEDENFKLIHNKQYLLSMANAGPNTNGSQFFILTGPAPHLDGKHVVFGEVIHGFSLIDGLNKVPTDENDKPNDNYTILDCGLVKQYLQ
jgi:peptidyl-prolyl isomerase D